MKKTLISVRIFLPVLILICTSPAFSEEQTKHVMIFLVLAMAFYIPESLQIMQTTRMSL